MAPAPSPPELRILDGLHAGAAVALQTASTLAIGSLDDDTDIVLRDLGAGQGGHLAWHDEAWHWHPRDGSAALLIRSGQVFACGAVLLTIQPEDAPWPDAATLARARPSPPADSAPVDSETISDTLPETGPGPTGPTTAAPPPPVPRRRNALATVLLCAVLGVAAFAATAAVLTHWATPALPEPPAPIASGDVHGLLATLDLDARLAVVETSGGNVEIHGFAADEDARARLDSAVSRLPRRPVLRVLTVAEAVERAADIARSQAPGLDVAAADATGSFTLTGLAADHDAVTRLIDRLMIALPRGAEFADASLHRDEVEAALAKLLRRHALPSPELAWNGGQLELGGRMAEEEIDRWESVMQALGDLFGARLNFVAHFELPSPAGFLRRNVRAVVSGDPPFVVTANGDKILVGGRLGRYRLLEVRDTLSIWEWPGGGNAFALER